MIIISEGYNRYQHCLKPRAHHCMATSFFSFKCLVLCMSLWAKKHGTEHGHNLTGDQDATELASNQWLLRGARHLTVITTQCN